MSTKKENKQSTESTFWTQSFGDVVFNKVEFSMGGQILDSTLRCDHCNKTYPGWCGDTCFFCGNQPKWMAEEKVKSNFKTIFREIENLPRDSNDYATVSLKHVKKSY